MKRRVLLLDLLGKIELRMSGRRKLVTQKGTSIPEKAEIFETHNSDERIMFKN